MAHCERKQIWLSWLEPGDRAPDRTEKRLSVTEAFPWVSAPTYLVRDNDRAYGHVFTSRVTAMGMTGRSLLDRHGKMVLLNV